MVSRRPQRSTVSSCRHRNLGSGYPKSCWAKWQAGIRHLRNLCLAALHFVVPEQVTLRQPAEENDVLVPAPGKNIFSPRPQYGNGKHTLASKKNTNLRARTSTPPPSAQAPPRPSRSAAIEALRRPVAGRLARRARRARRPRRQGAASCAVARTGGLDGGPRGQRVVA